MSLIVTISGSPSAQSRTALLARDVGRRLQAAGFETASVEVRELPADDLIQARLDSPALREPLSLVERAAGVIVATPIYKASFAGVLKTFLDLLPQFGLKGKTVLPIATGGTLAHVLAIDYGLRPVLSSLGPRHIVSGLFVLDKLLEKTDAGLRVDASVEPRLAEVVDELTTSVRRFAAP